jgi:hypothetical protein
MDPRIRIHPKMSWIRPATLQITNSEGERGGGDTFYQHGRGVGEVDVVSTTSAKNTQHSLSPDIVVLVLLLCWGEVGCLHHKAQQHPPQHLRNRFSLPHHSITRLSSISTTLNSKLLSEQFAQQGFYKQLHFSISIRRSSEKCHLNSKGIA